MLKQQEKRIMLTPFVVAHQSSVQDGSTVAAKAKKPGSHLTKEDATREVLNRIVQRVKKI